MIRMIIAFFITLNVFSFPVKPDIKTSPGSFCLISDRDFSELRYSEQIPYCKRNVSSKTKDEVCQRDGVWPRTEEYTVDHIIPLSLGGSNHKNNLWCQNKTISTVPLETSLYWKLNNSEISRLEAVYRLLKCKLYRLDC